MNESQLAPAVAAFFARGGRITTLPGYEPAPLPRRSDWIDPETVLKRAPKPEPKQLKVAAPIRKDPPADDEAAKVLRQCAADGMSVSAAGRLLGICESSARRKAARFGIEFRKYNQPTLTDNEVAEQASALFAAGHKLAATANRIGCGKNRLLRIAYEYGISQEGNQ